MTAVGFSLFETFMNKFYEASITVNMESGMLLVSSRDRFMAWATMFCFSAAACLVVFLVARKKPLKSVSLAAFVVTLVIPVIVIPSVRQGYIQVSPNHITVEDGIWFLDSRKEFYFDNLDNIREQVDGPVPGNLLWDPDVSWHFRWKDGSSDILQLNDFFNAHRMVVAYYIKDRGYRLERLEDQKKL